VAVESEEVLAHPVEKAQLGGLEAQTFKTEAGGCPAVADNQGGTLELD
jgi:hypothetical protein